MANGKMRHTDSLRHLDASSRYTFSISGSHFWFCDHLGRLSTKLIVSLTIGGQRLGTASAWAFGFLISCYQIFAFGKNAPNLQHFS